MENLTKRELGKAMFTQLGNTQKEIAEKLGVSEQSISKWAKADNWDDLKAFQSTTKDELLKQYYAMLKNINEGILTREEGMRFPTTIETKAIDDIQKRIQRLRGEIGIAEYIQVFIHFLNWLKPQDLNKAKEFRLLQDAFIQSLVK